MLFNEKDDGFRLSAVSDCCHCDGSQNNGEGDSKKEELRSYNRRIKLSVLFGALNMVVHTKFSHKRPDNRIQVSSLHFPGVTTKF